MGEKTYVLISATMLIDVVWKGLEDWSWEVAVVEVVVVVVVVGYCDREMSEFDGGVDKRRGAKAATAKVLLEDKDDRRVGKDLMVLI